MDFQVEAPEEAPETPGAILQDRRTPEELPAIGGRSSLLLLGLIDRPTGDLDILALFKGGAVRKLDELPEPLNAAAQLMAAARGLSENWLNTGPSSGGAHQRSGRPGWRRAGGSSAAQPRGATCNCV